MTTNYTIYVVNQSVAEQTFWCFLTPPQALVNDPGVFANSSASFAIQPNYGGTNSFVIPVQYVVGAGASNNAVGLNVEVISNFTQPTNLGQGWLASYTNAPPFQGPEIGTAANTTPNQIAITTNAFNAVQNDNAGWFANQSFGIVTEAGFIGMSWSPSPQQMRTLTPLLSFFIAVGSFGANSLASWDQISTGSAQVNAPDAFDASGDCTVTYTAEGGWVVAPGKPATQAIAENLAWFRSDEHHRLMALAYLENGTFQTDTIASVTFDNTSSRADVGAPVVTGTVTLTQALTAAFATFVISGITFKVVHQDDATTVKFSYSGPKSAAFIRALFKAGTQLVFGK